MRWSHVGLNCRDPRQTRDFYVRWFGFTPARVVPAGGREIIFIRRGDAHLELFPADPAEGQPASGDGPASPGLIRHLAFQVEDVGRFLADLGSTADITLGPLDFDEFIPGWRTVWIRDPDGVIVEVSQGYRDQEPDELAAAGPEAGARHG
jgi:glyoxylase I family protein